ncbi:MAG: hypothetical protein M3Q13_08685, partial [Pseudomonadota bacterium]|nr:hypothetical protein [Pseudomonadota bacterium]
MRVIIAGIIGGLVIFLWSMVAHTVLPIGEAGFKVPTQQDAVLSALAQSVAGEGVYMYPSMPMEQWNDKAASSAFDQQSRGKPYAFVVYQPGGNPVNQSMTPNLIKQFVTDTLAALVAAWILALGAWNFGRRVLVAGALGLFAWLAISLPQWNWYMFPMNLTLASLIEQVIGWLLAGAAMAWWLGRR